MKLAFGQSKRGGEGVEGEKDINGKRIEKTNKMDEVKRQYDIK